MRYALVAVPVRNAEKKNYMTTAKNIRRTQNDGV